MKINKELIGNMIPIARMEAMRIAWNYHKKRINNEDTDEILISFLKELKSIRRAVLSHHNENKIGISIIFLRELFNELLDLGKRNGKV